MTRKRSVATPEQHRGEEPTASVPVHRDDDVDMREEVPEHG